MKWGKNLIALVVAVILGLSLILVPVVSRLSPAQAAVTWTKYPGEVTLKYPVTLDNELYVVDAWVIRDGTTYEMWYTHAQKDLSISAIIDVIKGLSLDAIIGDISNLDLAQFLNDLDDLAVDVSAVEDLLDGISTVIGYATSTDGKTWTVQNSQALVGSSSAAWDSVGAPCVIKESDTSYKMWYTRAKIDLTQASLQTILTDIGTGTQTERKDAILDLLNSTGTVIGYATSSDGVNWPVGNQIPQVLPVSSDVGVWGSVADPSVVKTDGSYEMWYTRAETDVTQANLDTILTNIGTFGIADLLDILDGTAAVIGYATSSDGVTWIVQDSQVLPVSSGIGAWSSVANPSVVKTGGSYEMWYTNVKTNLVEANIHTLASEIKGLGISTLWNSLKTKSIADFIADLVALDIDTIKNVLSGTSAVIGYATSGDGINWTVQNSQHLVGSSGSPWSSVAAPSVVKTGDRYEMWYTEGFRDLTWQNIADIVLGRNLPIGYAYYTPPALPPPPPPTIETELFGIEESFPISDDGVIQETIEATSDAGDFTITIPEDTIALDEDGDPLSTFTVELDLDPPDPPAGAHIIGIPYKFGPPGATFSPPMTIEFTVDPATLPPGVALEDLVIAYYDETLVPPAWVELTTTYDPVTNTLMAEVSHFTTFAVLAYTRPAAFAASDLSVTPAEVDIGETVTISTLVTNTGDLTGSYEVTLKIDDVVVATKEVTLAGGASQKVTFTTAEDVAGTYSVDVSGLTGSFTVKEEVVPPVPAAFAISNLSISPTEVDIGKEVTIGVLIANTGDLTGSYEVTLKVDNVVVATKEVTLAGGASQRVTFTIVKNVAATYAVNVDGLTGTFMVKEEVVPPVVPPVVPKPIAWWVWLIIGLVSAVVVGFAVWMVVRRRRA